MFMSQWLKTLHHHALASVSGTVSPLRTQVEHRVYVFTPQRLDEFRQNLMFSK